MMMKTAKWFMTAVVFVAFTGCASIAWKDALTVDTLAAYEDFVRRYPESEFAKEAGKKVEVLYFDKAKTIGTEAVFEAFLSLYPKSEFSEEARQKIEALRFDKVKVTGTIASYEIFLKNNPNSNFAAEASRNLEVLKKELRNIEEATRKVLPKGASVEVTTLSRYPKEPEFVIAAHLLEGHSTNEENSSIRGDYGTHEKLTRLVQLRCVKIIKSVAKNAMPSNKSVLVVRSRHGVRERKSGRDVATTIYEVSIPTSVLRDIEISSMDIESVIKLWKVQSDIIPTLEFKPEFR